jgi:hypothetical protein
MMALLLPTPEEEVSRLKKTCELQQRVNFILLRVNMATLSLLPAHFSVPLTKKTQGREFWEM